MTAIKPAVETINDKKFQRLVIALTLLGFALRLIGLGQHSYWFDEAREVLRALTPWPGVLSVSEGVDPPLYRLLLYPIGLLTTQEFWLRMPSAVFSAAAIYLAYYWLVLLGWPRLGMVTAVLFTFAPIQIFYAQEVSQYSMVVFLAVALLVVFERAGRNGRWRDWLLLTLVSLIAVYTYYGLAWLLPILTLDLAWRTWQNRTKTRLLGFISHHLVLGGGITALYFLLLSGHIARFTTRKHLTPKFIDPGFGKMIKYLDTELLENFVRFFAIPNSPQAPVVIPLIFAGLALIGGAVLWRKGLAGKRLVIYAVGTIAAMYIANGLGLYPFGRRYALAALPFFMALIASVIWALWRIHFSIGTVLMGALLFVFLWFAPTPRLIPNSWLILPTEELRPVVAYVNEQAQPGDFIYVYYGAQPAYQVYQREQLYPTTFGPWFRQWPTADKLDDIQQTAAGYERFWLVMSHIHGNEDDELVNGLSGDAYRVADEFAVKNAAAVLFYRNE